MTTGYSASIILSKSRTYNQSIYVTYDISQFFIELGGGIFFLFLLKTLVMKLVGQCNQFIASELLSSTYRVSANETISVDRELKPVL